MARHDLYLNDEDPENYASRNFNWIFFMKMREPY